jgi:hypothetical protein
MASYLEYGRKSTETQELVHNFRMQFVAIHIDRAENRGIVNKSEIYETKVCFKHRASHVPNALKTIDNHYYYYYWISWNASLSIVSNAFGTWDARRLKQVRPNKSVWWIRGRWFRKSMSYTERVGGLQTRFRLTCNPRAQSVFMLEHLNFKYVCCKIKYYTIEKVLQI